MIGVIASTDFGDPHVKPKIQRVCFESGQWRSDQTLMILILFGWRIILHRVSGLKMVLVFEDMISLDRGSNLQLVLQRRIRTNILFTPDVQERSIVTEVKMIGVRLRSSVQVVIC